MRAMLHRLSTYSYAAYIYAAIVAAGALVLALVKDHSLEHIAALCLLWILVVMVVMYIMAAFENRFMKVLYSSPTEGLIIKLMWLLTGVIATLAAHYILGL